jgi:hypothetical protein
MSGSSKQTLAHECSGSRGTKDPQPDEKTRFEQCVSSLIGSLAPHPMRKFDLAFGICSKSDAERIWNLLEKRCGNHV